MKRFFNYYREDGEVYEICADVKKCNGRFFIVVFNELPIGDIMSFVTTNKNVIFHNVLDEKRVMIPIEMVKYVGDEMLNSKDNIRCCGYVNKSESEE